MAENSNSYPPDGPRREEGVDTLGGILAAARTRQGLTVEQMAAELRVESRLLEALEADRFEMLPAPVFIKGYLRHLASRFGLDYDDLIHRYTVQTDAKDAPVTYSEPIPEDNKLLVPLIIGALVLVVGIPAFWFTWVSRDSLTEIVTSDEQAPESPPAQVEPVPTGVAPVPDPDFAVEPPAPPPAIGLDPVQLPMAETAPGDGAAAADTSATESNPEGAPGAGDEPASETEAPDPAPPGDQPPAGADPAVEPQPPEPGAAEPGATNLTGTVANEQVGGPMVRVALSYAEDSWTEVSDGNGNSLYYALGMAGSTVSRDGVLPLSFFLGNSRGVEVSINDQPWPVPEPQGNATTMRFVVAEAP